MIAEKQIHKADLHVHFQERTAADAYIKKVNVMQTCVAETMKMSDNQFCVGSTCYTVKQMWLFILPCGLVNKWVTGTTGSREGGADAAVTRVGQCVVANTYLHLRRHLTCWKAGWGVVLVQSLAYATDLTLLSFYSEITVLIHVIIFSVHCNSL